MEALIFVVLLAVALGIAVLWNKAWNKPKGKSNGGVDMPEPHDNNEGDQNQ